MASAKKPTAPKLRFPQFVGEWQSKPLSTVLRVKGKRNFDNSFDRNDVLSVSGDLGVINQIEHLGRSYAGVLVDNYHVVDTGDIVYTKSPLKRNPYGIIKANKGKPGIVSTLYAVYEVNQGQSFKFWDRYFELDDHTNRYLKPLVNKGAKNDMKINNDRVLIDPVRFPPFLEQEKIAAFLEAVDTKLTGLRRKRDLLADYKRGVMQQLFSQKLRFKRDDGAAFPDWKEKRLGDVATFDKGKGVSKTDTAAGGATPCIRYAELYTHYGEIIDSPISSTNEPPDRLTLSLGGEIIVPASGETAEDIATFACVIRAGVAIGGDINIIRTPGIDGRFLARYLGNHRRGEIAKLAQGNSIVHLYGSQLSKVAIAVPHLEEQRKIAEFLAALDAKIDAVASQITQIEAFKKSLLQQMFV